MANVNKWATSKILIIVFLIILGLETNAKDITEFDLYAKIKHILSSHSTVLAAKKDITAAIERTEVAKGGWYPQMTITSHYGKEYQDNFTGDNTNLVTRDFNINITQLLWDFGITDNTIKSAELQKKITDIQLLITKNDLLLRALTAHVNLVKSFLVDQFALQSESNIKRQASLEDALVRKGAGLTTDVLQAKVTLAGAQARRVQTSGALKLSLNSYYTLFREFPKSIKKMKNLILPANVLPTSLGDAIKTALISNVNIKAANIGIKLAKTIVDINSSQGFLPLFQVTGDAKYKKDLGGSVGFEKEYLGKLQFTYPLNLGMTAINSLRASESDANAAELRIKNLKEQIEEQVRNGWVSYQTATENSKLLSNQANIAGEFLELARKERKLGKRELIEVLTGETSLINAQSDAISAKNDVVIAGLTLLSLTGRLDITLIPELIK